MIRRRQWKIETFALVVCVLATPAHALVGDRDEAFGIDCSLRTITGASNNYDFKIPYEGGGGFYDVFPERSDGFSQSILRLEIGGRPAEWLGYEVHGVQDLNLTTTGELFGDVLFGAGSTSMYRVTDASWEWGEEPHVQARMWLDRVNLKFSLPWFDVTVGRQAITFGKAYFWNPMDVFLAFDPRQFDRDYKAGVDALRVDVPLGDFSGITLVSAAGRDDAGVDFGATWYGSAVLARAFTNLWNWDFAVQGGKIFGGYQVGAAVSGELGPIEVRGEGAYFIAMDDEDPLPDHFTGVLGVGHRFEFNLLIEAEYLYNGSGDADDLQGVLEERLGPGRTFHMGEHLFGMIVNYEILPILQGSLAWIFSFSDYSSLLQPGFVLSVSNEADFIFGAIIALGARPSGGSVQGFPPEIDLGLQSEFGTYPNFYYMEFKFYF